MRYLLIPLTIVGLLLALAIIPQVQQRLDDSNRYKAQVEALDLAQRQAQLQDQLDQQAATAASRAAASNAGYILTALAGALAIAYAVDFARKRSTPLVRIDGVPIARQLAEQGETIAILAAKVQGHAAAQLAEAQRPLVPAHLVYSPHWNNRQADLLLPDSAAAPALPPAATPTFAELLAAGRVGRGNPLVLGFDGGAEISGTWLDLYSTAVAGMPGTGKTTSQRFLACQTALQGARFAILDPHADAGAESLAGTLAPLSAAFVCEPASDDKAILETVRYVADVGKRRISGKDSDTTPLILWADELTALLGRSAVGDQLAELLERIAQEYRKRHVFVCGSGQIWTASRTTSELRDSFASVLCHRMKRGQARMLLPTEEAQQVERLATGQAVLWRTSGQTQTIVIPNTTAADVQQVGRMLGGEPSDPPSRMPSGQVAGFGFGRLAEGKRKVSAEGTEGAPAAAKPSAEAARIVQLFLSGKSIPEIVAEIWQLSSNGGRAYVERRALVEQTIRQALGGAA